MPLSATSSSSVCNLISKRLQSHLQAVRISETISIFDLV
ncbi:hypothetical protein C347_03970 [Cryptococcus neoformans AD2-60a]|nr:hypothetical protein C347_03970 [Cryptococcus neoformans var. grubii AD2-60a]OXC84059.1 hypothetical protein C344_03667 [Cryptococcus neoformans var. grubii AD1-7a]OXH30867.1 hypothetical protein J005_03758 [Cryptococcus neoformans var. grubii]